MSLIAPPAALLRPEVREALQTLTFQGCQAAHDQVGVVMMQYAALLGGKQGRGGFLLIAQAPRRAPGLIAEARAGDAEVGFAPHASGPGEASAGGAQRPSDLRMH